MFATYFFDLKYSHTENKHIPSQPIPAIIIKIKNTFSINGDPNEQSPVLLSGEHGFRHGRLNIQIEVGTKRRQENAI